MFEWNGKVYFGWPLPPWCGVVYEVKPEAVGPKSVVYLPDKTELQLIWGEDNWLEVTITSILGRDRARVFPATRIFDNGDEYPTFAGDWEPMLRLINIAAAVNTLFVVYLPPEEYKRLAANNEVEFKLLKESMSERAASLVRLEENYYGEGKSVVWLLRTGRCQ